MTVFLVLKHRSASFAVTDIMLSSSCNPCQNGAHNTILSA